MFKFYHNPRKLKDQLRYTNNVTLPAKVTLERTELCGQMLSEDVSLDSNMVTDLSDVSSNGSPTISGSNAGPRR